MNNLKALEDSTRALEDSTKALERDLTRGFNRAFDELPEGSLPALPIKGYTVTVSLITDAPPLHEKGEEEEPVVVYLGPLGIAIVSTVVGAVVGAVTAAIAEAIVDGPQPCNTTTSTQTASNADGSSMTQTTTTTTCTAR